MVGSEAAVPSEAANPSEAAVPSEGTFGVEATADAPMPANHGEDPTAAGTTVRVRDRAVPGESAEELLYEVPGARPLQTGMLGSFAGVALRGAGLTHTTVLLGNLPLHGADTGPFNLNLVPLAALERIEVYRGGAPVWLGDGAIGGVVRLIPRRDHTSALGATATAGSFGTFTGSGHASVAGDHARVFATVGVRHTEGNYPFVDDVTLLTPGDEVVRRRQNAWATDAYQLLTVTADAGQGELQAVLLGLSRLQGDPGPASRPAPDARRNLQHGFAALGWHRDHGGPTPWRVQLAVGGGMERNRFTDLYAQVGIGRERTDDLTAGAFLRTATSAALARWLELGLVGNVRYDRYEPEDSFALRPVGASERWTPSLAVEPRIHGKLGALRVDVRPSARVAFSSARVASTRVTDDGVAQARTHVLPTLRLGVAVSPTAWLAIAGSAATGARLPSVVELFGDRGTLLPNPALRPEGSTAYDLGVTARARGPQVRGSIEARAFWTELRDLIRYRRTAQFTAIAENVEQARSTGLELGVQGEAWTHLHVQGALTWMDTRVATGQELPQRPRVVAQLRPELRSGPLGDHIDDVGLHVGLVHVGANFVDPANLARLPPRTWVHVGARLDAFDGLRASLVERDVFDRRGTDLLGFPLPGRRVTLSVAYHRDL
ncbi:MAG: TonB-dependent receptor plug domain-containing protein [Sandaracinaceae bacterium]